MSKIKAFFKALWAAITKPTPVDPVKPDPVEPPADSFPAVTFAEVHRTRDNEWNISFHGNGIVGEYKNSDPRNQSRLVGRGTKKDLIAGDPETMQAAADGSHFSAEKGRGAPVLSNGVFSWGRKPRHKISLCTGVIGGRSVTFSSDQKKEACSDWEDSATGERLGTLHVSGAVIAAVPYGTGLLCALQGGERATCVTTGGAELPLDAWSLVRSDTGRIFAGAHDGRVMELVGGSANHPAGAWVNQSLMPLGGRVMSLECDGPYLWAATSKGDLWCILSDGQARRVYVGKVDYGDKSWFGPKVKAREFAVKIPDGSSWRCVILRLGVAP